MIEKNIDKYRFLIFENKFKLTCYITEYISNKIKTLLNVNDRFKFCVCGGSTPRAIYDELSNFDLPWQYVDIFLGDERCVHPMSELSNSLMLKNSLLTNYGSKAFFYEIFSDKEVDDNISKKLLISKLFEKCNNKSPTFDLTLLGLGDDGHTASLFPYQNNNADEFVIFNEGKGVKRISLTPKLLSASQKIIFLVSGASKQLALKRLLDKNESKERTPSKLIKSRNQISIFCDEESAKELLT